MKRENELVTKLAQTALMAALCFVSFTFLQIKIPMPGGDATSLHIGNAFCVLAALLLGGLYGGLAGAIGMGIADIIDPVYITVAPKTFVLKLCIGLITGLISQIPLLNATPLVNIASELVGAVVCGILVAALVKVAADNKGLQNVVFPLIIAFISTVFSGYTFALIVGVGLSGLGVAEVLVMYAVMVLGTATMNAVVAAILAPVLRSVLKR